MRIVALASVHLTRLRSSGNSWLSARICALGRKKVCTVCCVVCREPLACLRRVSRIHTSGNELDEFQAHRFLELVGETLTVIALRDRLRKIDLDMNRYLYSSGLNVRDGSGAWLSLSTWYSGAT